MSYVALFPGQGSQYKGMCKSLLERNSSAAHVVQTASDVLGTDVLELLSKGTLQQLTSSELAQPLVVAASVCYFQSLLEKQGELPYAGIGHSLGELSSYVCAEAICLKEGLQFAKKRGELMESAILKQKGNAGLAIDIELEKLEPIIVQLQAEGGALMITGYNSRSQFIVAGDRQSLKQLDQHMEKLGAQFIPFRMVPMKADAPYHSSFMQFLQQDMEELVDQLTISAPWFPTLSTVTKSLVDDPAKIRVVLKDQLMTPVYWTQAIDHPLLHENLLFIDVGPNQIMHNLVLEHNYEKKCYAYDEMID